MTRRIIATSGLPERAARTLAVDPKTDILLDLYSPQHNLTLQAGALAKSLGRSISPDALDLLEVCALTVAADVACPRGENEEWTRTLHLLFPVRAVEPWRAAQRLYTEIVHFLSWDNLTINFVRAEQPRRPASPQGREEDRFDAGARRASGALPRAEGQRTSAGAPHSPGGLPPDCVCLLSGGLDSLAGAFLLLERGRRPLFVMHRSANPTTQAAQRHVIRTVQEAYPAQCRAVGVGFAASRVLAPYQPFPPLGEPEASQRTRSLFFLAVGAVAASALGVDEVYVPENGILAVHVPMSLARIGSRSTRTAHPTLLSMFADLVEHLLGKRIRFVNPLVEMTKGEIVRDILKPRVSQRSIRKTESCWRAGRQSRPCGACVPCLLRRLAFAWGGIGAETYEADLLADPPAHRKSDGYRNLIDLLSVTRDFYLLPDGHLLARYPDLLLEELPPEAVIGTYRRFAAEVVELAKDEFPALGGVLHL